MRFTVGTTAEGKPAVYLGGVCVRVCADVGMSAAWKNDLNAAIDLLMNNGPVRTELACIFLNAGEGWIGKEPATVQHSGTFDVHSIEVSGDVDAKADAALTWTPKMIDAIGEQLRESLGQDFHDTEDFESVRSQGGM